MYFKNFINEFKCNRAITTINIIGYSIALTVCLMIGIYVYYHFSFNSFNEKSDRIYLMNYFKNSQNKDNATTNHHWYEVLPQKFEGIEKMARFGWHYGRKIEYNNNVIEAVGADGDKELFDIFSFPVLQKASENFFSSPNSVAISKSLAKKIFGNKSAIGEIIKINYDQNYTVTAVFDDIPENSSIKFELLLNADDVLASYGTEMNDHWLWWMWRTFVLVDQNWDTSGFEEKMKPLQKEYIGDWHADDFDYYLQPLKEIHLHSASISGSFGEDISITFIYILCSAGLLILIISCINYINLSISGFESRKKSVSIKKIIGSGKQRLFWEYFYYSLFLTFLCLLISVLFSLAALPTLNILGNETFSPFKEPFFWGLLVILGVLVGSLSGIYPALYISKTQVISKLNANRTNFSFRNALITFQFSIAIILLISVFFIKKQLYISINGDLGYNYHRVISIKGSETIYNHHEAFHEELNKLTGVENTTSCSFELPGYLGNYWPVKPTAADNTVEIYHTSVAPNFFEFLNIPVTAQVKPFNEDTALETNNAVINSEAVKRFGLGQKIFGKSYYLGETKIEVIGGISDFHIGSLHTQIKPIQFSISKKGWNNLIEINKLNADETVADIKKLWESFEKVKPFNYMFIDELIKNQYLKEQKISKLFNLFFSLTMLISVIGIVGLVYIILRFRIKEIGIRKVNGAKTKQILTMLNQDFLKWVVIAFVIACPIAWYAMNRWLENFAYKTRLSWWVFALAGVIAVVIALVTVSWQSWRAASRNPVEALRYE